jgi:hypothetical protein
MIKGMAATVELFMNATKKALADFSTVGVATKTKNKTKQKKTLSKSKTQLPGFFVILSVLVPSP